MADTEDESWQSGACSVHRKPFSPYVLEALSDMLVRGS